MALTRTFTCTPGPDVVREAVTFTSAVDFDNGGLQHIFSRAQRPLYRFELRLGPLTRQEVESLSAFHSFHMGGKSFFWNGGPHGAVINYNLIGEGDGARRDFLAPNRYIGTGSHSIRTVNQATQATSTWTTSAYVMNSGPGLFTFNNSINTIPKSGHDIQAIYGCQYRTLFEPGGIKVNQIAAGLWSADIKLIETAFQG